MKARRLFGTSLGGVLLLVLAACSSAPPPPGIVTLTVKAAADVNPDGAGRASPVAVRAYQLSSPGKFNSVDFYQLFDKEKATLGSDLVDRQEVIVPPGETRKLVMPLKQGTRVLAVAAAFRDIDQAHWREVIEVPANGPTALEADLSGTRIALVGPGS